MYHRTSSSGKICEPSTASHHLKLIFWDFICCSTLERRSVDPGSEITKISRAAVVVMAAVVVAVGLSSFSSCVVVKRREGLYRGILEAL